MPVKPRNGILYKNNEKLLSIFLILVPVAQDCFKQFPTPEPDGPDLSQGLPGGEGMVTGGIEPYITKL